MAEQRAGDTWRNILALLDAIKVVEYDPSLTGIRMSRGVGY
jgi:hypothetical protein